MPLLADAALALLKKAAAGSRLPHACLLSGPEGSGKRMIAAGMAAFLLGRPPSAWPPPPHPDLHVVMPESKSRRILIEQIRELEHLIHLRPSSAAKKVGIILDADRLQPQAANAFLKTLEEPPPDSFLILTTPNPGAILPTILSRCIGIPLRRAGSGGTPETAAVAALLEKHLGGGDLSLPSVLGLVRGIEALLQVQRERLQEEAEERLKAERKQWPEGMPAEIARSVEAKLKAAAEARYAALRAAVLDAAAEWWVRLAKACAGAGVSPAPKLAEKLGTARVTAFFDTIEALRDQLDRNVQETLAMETAFLSLCD